MLPAIHAAQHERAGRAFARRDGLAHHGRDGAPVDEAGQHERAVFAQAALGGAHQDAVARALPFVKRIAREIDQVFGTRPGHGRDLNTGVPGWTKHNRQRPNDRRPGPTMARDTRARAVQARVILEARPIGSGLVLALDPDSLNDSAQRRVGERASRIGAVVAANLVAALALVP